MTQAIIHQHIEASREAGTLAAVEHIADELAVALNADPDRVRAILHRDRDEANEIGRRRRELDYEVWAERLDERTTEALDALSNLEKITEEEECAA
jgi:CO/xanthine dehydrogenase Mo-binding subunit